MIDKQRIIKECMLNVDSNVLKFAHYFAIEMAMDEYADKMCNMILNKVLIHKGLNLRPSSNEISELITKELKSCQKNCNNCKCKNKKHE